MRHLVRPDMVEVGQRRNVQRAVRRRQENGHAFRLELPKPGHREHAAKLQRALLRRERRVEQLGQLRRLQRVLDGADPQLHPAGLRRRGVRGRRHGHGALRRGRGRVGRLGHAGRVLGVVRRRDVVPGVHEPGAAVRGQRVRDGDVAGLQYRAVPNVAADQAPDARADTAPVAAPERAADAGAEPRADEASDARAVAPSD